MDQPTSDADHARILDDICAVLGIRQLTGVTLGGFSLGDAIAIHSMARHDGDHVAKLALFGAAAPAGRAAAS